MISTEIKWDAVVNNNQAYDSVFYYAIKTTGIYCRPSCKSKLPLRKNVVFYDRKEEAIEKGFRACKRCRPDLLEYQPIKQLAEQTKWIIDSHYADKGKVSTEIKKLGITQNRFIQLFKQYFRETPLEYANRLRADLAKKRLKESDEPITSIAFSLDFDSLSAFYTFFRKYTNMTPKEYRVSVRERTMQKFIYYYETSIGKIGIVEDGIGITNIFFDERSIEATLKETKCMKEASRQLEEYIKGTRKQFDLPFNLSGTEFQQRVWKALQAIPYGETRSYKQIAEMINNPKASRAVGMANNKNPIPIIIPCHRVVGANGSLVGYAGGLEMKQKLLNLER